jgi:hypothetical protein
MEPLSPSPHKKNVLLFHPPWAEPAFSNRDFTVLQEALEASGIHCTTAYGNLNLATALGRMRYAESGRRCREPGRAHDVEFQDEIERCFSHAWRRGAVPPAQVVWLPLSTEQFWTSIQLARYAKQQSAQARVVMSGPLATETTAYAFLQRFPQVDAVVSEAGLANATWCVRALCESRVPYGLDGVFCRGDPNRQPRTAEPLRVAGRAASDHSGFIESIATAGLRIRPVLPLSALVDEQASTAELLDTASRYRVLRFDLGYLDPAKPVVVAFLKQMAQLRREGLYGFELWCRVSPRIGGDSCRLLKAAGVTQATVDLHAEGDGELGWATDINSQQIQAVRLLDDAGVKAAWDFALPTADAASDDASWVSGLAALYHLPPPRGIVAIPFWENLPADRVRSLSSAIETWREAFDSSQEGPSPRRLTYAQGPGFIRIFDRRSGLQNWTFVTLNARQSELFRFCDEGRSLPEIVAAAPEFPEPAVRQFLDLMVERQLMLRSRDGRYYLLPIRRRLEERWTSGDY